MRDKLRESKYFLKKEFECQCDYPDCDKSAEIDRATLFVAESVRRKFGRAVTISSGIRCTKHNKDESGDPNSKHIKKIALDIKVKGISTRIVYDWLDETYGSLLGLGYSKNFVHVDTRGILVPTSARWTY